MKNEQYLKQNFWIVPTFHLQESTLNCVSIVIIDTSNITPKLLTTWLNNFVSLPTLNSFMIYLGYTTRINLILQPNLYYKKVLKCVDYSNFLRTSLNYKNAETLPTSHHICFWIKLQCCWNVLMQLTFHATDAFSKIMCG